jgi:hypothetical protein
MTAAADRASSGAGGRAAPRAQPGGARRGLAALLWLAAALISGFTMRRYLEPFDEGLLMQGASRILDGQWPYADFGWPYGPGQPVAVASLSWLFDPSVAWWRLLRVAADATAALAVWALVRPAGPRWAAAAWLAAAVTVAQPTSANPFPVALAFALCAVLAAARTRPVLAGALAALAAFWRPDIGAVAAVAAVVALLLTPRARDAGERRAVLAAGVAAVAAALLYLPFAVAAGFGTLWDELVGIAAGDGDLWRLPFPLAYDGPLRSWPPSALAEHLKDVLGFYLPLAGLVVGALVLLTLAWRRRPTAELAGVLVLAAGCALYLLSRPDDLHAQPLIVCLCAAVPLAAAGAPGTRKTAAGAPRARETAAGAPRARETAAGAPQRVLRAALAAGLALIVLAGAANRLSALLLPPDLEPVHLAGVPGIRVPPAEAAALPRLAERVQRLVPRGEPIYVAPRRSDLVTISDPLVHFLVHRPNVLDRDVSVQALAEEQARIVAALRRTGPKAVVRWTDPASARPEPNRRGRPSGSRELDEYLAAEYRLDSRFGAYDVLVPR